MTDQDALSILQYRLIETVDGGATMSSGLWTVDECIDALNASQQWMMRETWPIVSRATLTTVPTQWRYPLPQDWMESIRVVWVEADGTSASLCRDSSWSSDYMASTWTALSGRTPQSYSDSEAPIPMLQVMPAAYDNGLLDVWYCAVPPALSNTGVAWVLPDMLIPPCIWKATAIVLGKDGRGQDLPRAQAALQRAQEGLEAATLMLGGWRAGL